MASVNKCILIGNLGRDPEVRHLPSGDAVANMAIATSESWKDKTTGEKKEATEWHRVTAFGRLAEICGEYLKKGSSVYIEGSLRTKKYTDKDGVEKYSTEIRADQMRMLGGAPSGNDGAGQSRPANNQSQPRAGQQQPQQNQSRPASNFSDMDDDIPF